MTGPRDWLIWSNYHNAWHRRGSEGGANGYTDRIGEAGIFDEAKAMAYHRDGRNIALKRTGRTVRSRAKAELKRLNNMRDQIAKSFANVDAILAKTPPSDDVA